MASLEKHEQHDLWKHFSNDAERVKEKLWTVSIWLFALLGSVLGFIVKLLNDQNLIFTQKPLVMVACGVGLLLCLYAWWMITSYGNHVRTAWNRTNHILKSNEKLRELWLSGYLDDKRIEKEKEIENPVNTFPKFANRIRVLVLLFGLAFFVLIIWCLVGS